MRYLIEIKRNDSKLPRFEARTYLGNERIAIDTGDEAAAFFYSLRETVRNLDGSCDLKYNGFDQYGKFLLESYLKGNLYETAIEAWAPTRSLKEYLYTNEMVEV